MRRLARALDGAEWAAANMAYPSTRRSLAAHAAAASHVARGLAEDGAKSIDFVGHSLGGLVAHAAMARAATGGWSPGRRVLIGTPAGGSSVARTLCRLPLYAAALGPCGAVLAQKNPAPLEFPNGRDVVVIAGGTGGAGFNPLLDGDNDFTVTVAETRLTQTNAHFMRVRAMHDPLMGHPATIAATLSFLATGRLRA
jgi:pimeloyl-ACP methyl ester carboxylesterase